MKLPAVRKKWECKPGSLNPDFAAMLDAMDKGTAIFKCACKPPLTVTEIYRNRERFRFRLLSPAYMTGSRVDTS